MLRKPLNQPLPKITEIDIETMDLGLANGTITLTDIGSENLYFIDQFDNQFYCKCYPQSLQDVMPTDTGNENLYFVGKCGNQFYCKRASL